MMSLQRIKYYISDYYVSMLCVRVQYKDDEHNIKVSSTDIERCVEFRGNGYLVVRRQCIYNILYTSQKKDLKCEISIDTSYGITNFILCLSLVLFIFHGGIFTIRSFRSRRRTFWRIESSSRATMSIHWCQHCILSSQTLKCHAFLTINQATSKTI